MIQTRTLQQYFQIYSFYIHCSCLSWTKIKKTASDEEDGEADEVLSLAGSVDAIWLEVVLSSEENAWYKGAAAGNVWDMVE